MEIFVLTMLNPKAYIEGHRHLLNSLKLQSNKRSREDTQWFTAHTTHLHLELEAAPVSKESDTLRYSQIYSDALFCSLQTYTHTDIDNLKNDKKYRAI